MTPANCGVERQFQLDESKFRELILYIADKCSDDSDFGATKLNKILFYSDFFAYGEFRKPITGATYFKLQRGPAPKQLIPIREQMVENGDIAIQPKRRFHYQQERVIPLREANLDYFSAKEIAIVDEVIGIFCGVNADTASRLSHMELGWRIAGEQEDIPYETVFLSNLPLSDYEIEHGLGLAEKYGWAIQGS